jgi:tRNA (guanine37-N1)-methyltransferase
MVMLAEPLLRALAAVRADRAAAELGEAPRPASPVPPLPVVHFSPAGRRLDQQLVREFARGPGALLVCGRYEGIDQRFVERCVTHELSLGDVVLSGGELPALVLLDAVARLQAGVLPPESVQQESFSEGDPAAGVIAGLLEGPHYSRPETLVLEGERADVPPVLLSGHHERIARWRRERSLEMTARRRPDLLARARSTGQLTADDERFLASLGEGPPL